MKPNSLYRPAALATSAFIALAAFGLSENTAQAAITVIASDDFNYADGTLIGKNGGTGFSTAWGGGYGARNIVSGQVSIQNGQILRTLADSPFSNTSGEVFLTFDFRSITIGGYGGISLYSEGLETFAIGTFGSDPDWMIKYGSARSTANNISTITESATTGIVRFTLGAAGTTKAELWVTSIGSTVDFETATPVATLSNLNLSNVNRVRIASGSGSNTLTDNLVIYTIPEPTSVALLGLCGVFAFMRRRRG